MPNKHGSCFAVDLQRTHREPFTNRDFSLFSRRRSKMATRQQLVLVFAAIILSMGASYRTTNFVVEAPTPQIAQQVGQMAEYYRKEKAIQWLGQEMRPWPQPCPLRVTVTMGGAGGATSFNFDRGQVWQTMNI